MQENTDTRWGSRAKWLHWLIAFMILMEVPVGFIMAQTYGAKFNDNPLAGLHILMAQIHITNGFCILALVAYRLTWRFKNPAPGLPASLETYQRWLARLTHTFLYTLLFLMPLSGWAANSVLGDSEQFGVTELWFLAWNIMPPILPQLPLDHQFGYTFFAKIHRYALYTGGVVLSLHLLAAIWHHFVRKDNILLRMWPAGATEAEREAANSFSAKLPEL
jgi:cytochrome b561